MDKPFIINQLEKGIGASPSVGWEDIRNLDIISAPGEVSLNYGVSALTAPPTVSAVAFTVVASTDIFTVSSTSGWFNGMAITLNSIVTATGISTGRVYWVGNISGNTFQLYTTPGVRSATLVNVTADGSGTLSSYTLSTPIGKTIDYGTTNSGRVYEFILDDAGRAWWIANIGGTVSNSLIYLGNDTLTGGFGRAIVTWKKHLLVFRSTSIDALNLVEIEGIGDLDAAYASGGWSYGFSSCSQHSTTTRPVLNGQDDILYFGNVRRVGSLSQTSGSTFDPTSGATFTRNISALDLPNGDDVLSLGELGVNLLIGGLFNYIYPWNRTDPSFKLPIQVPENRITQIISQGGQAFIFAGNRGRIYISNGYSVEPYLKFPDHLSGYKSPIYTFADVLISRNQIYFSLTATQNDGTAISTLGGVWGIDIPSRALRYTTQPSTADYAATVKVILPNLLTTTPAGQALYIGWVRNSTYGVDVSSSSFVGSYGGYGISPLYHVGTVNNKATFTNIDVTFTRPLAANEGIKVSYRKDDSSAFSSAIVLDYATFGAVVGINQSFPISDAQFVQLKVELTAPTTTTPSFREIKLS